MMFLGMPILLRVTLIGGIRKIIICGKDWAGMHCLLLSPYRRVRQGRGCKRADQTSTRNPGSGQVDRMPSGQLQQLMCTVSIHG